MIPPKVKYCGITTLRDAQFAQALGVDALGFNFYEKSKRYVTPENARDITSKLAPKVWKVGVFVNENPEKVRSIVERVGLDSVQFHGDESPDYCSQFKNLRVLKAIRLKDEKSVLELDRYKASVDFLLLDSYHAAEMGGTGVLANEAFLRGIARELFSTNVFLAGGLTSENVSTYVTQYRPFGVDVASGIESAPGIKDEEKMSRFFEATRKEA